VANIEALRLSLDPDEVAQIDALSR
jgi:hypothetical protein